MPRKVNGRPSIMVLSLKRRAVSSLKVSLVSNKRNLLKERERKVCGVGAGKGSYNWPFLGRVWTPHGFPLSNFQLFSHPRFSSVFTLALLVLTGLLPGPLEVHASSLTGGKEHFPL